jgi:hypothetical protein
MSRFRQRIGPERLERIMEAIVGRLRDAGVVKGDIVTCDATFIQAYSKRDLKDDSRGYSDLDARVGRAERGYRLGYKLHLAVDAHSELPLAVIAASANEKEKKHAPKLLKKAIQATSGKLSVLVPAEAEFLRVDKQFRTHGPQGLKRLYRHKASAERTISRLKQHISLENHKVKGLRKILIHALLCIIAMLLTALTKLA